MEVNKKDFLGALELLSPIAKLDTFLQEKCLVFRGMTVSVFAAECAAHVSIPADQPLFEEMVFVSFESFSKCMNSLKTLPTETFSVSLSPDISSVLVRDGKTRITIPIQEDMDSGLLSGYGEVPANMDSKLLSSYGEVPANLEMVSLPETFSQMVGELEPFWRDKNQGDVFHCLHLTKGFYEACDRVKLMRVFEEVPVTPEEGILLSGKCLLSLKPFMGFTHFQAPWLWFCSDNGAAQIRTIDGIYPSLDRIISKQDLLIEFPESLLAALKRAKTVGKDAKLCLDIGPKKISLSTTGSISLSEVVPVEGLVQEPIKFSCSLEGLELVLSISLAVSLNKTRTTIQVVEGSKTVVLALLKVE